MGTKMEKEKNIIIIFLKENIKMERGME